MTAFAAILFSVAVSSCDDKESSSSSSKDIVGTTWRANSYEFVYTLTFDSRSTYSVIVQDMEYGDTSRHSGTYTMQGSSINLDEVMVGRINGNTMTLTIDGEVLVFTKM